VATSVTYSHLSLNTYMLTTSEKVVSAYVYGHDLARLLFPYHLKISLSIYTWLDQLYIVISLSIIYILLSLWIGCTWLNQLYEVISLYI